MLFCLCLLLSALALTTTGNDNAPRIVISPRNQTVTAGNPAFFVCTATGNPKPKIEWQKNSKNIFSVRYLKLDISEGSLMRIEPVRERSDDTTFKCIAENSAGDPAIATAVLTVLSEIYRPTGFPEFVYEPSVKVVERGHTVLLPRKVHGDPSPTVTWLKNMLPLNMTVSRYSIVDASLRITDVEDDDEGRYECVAENSAGSLVSRPINLYVRVGKVPPRFDVRPDPLYEVIPGGNLNVTCIAVGQPMPLVKWQAGSANIDQKSEELIGRNTLILENITSSVNYTCTASSRLGVIESFTEIIVKDASQNSSSSRFPENASDCECERRHSEERETEKCPPAYKDGCTCPDQYDCAKINSTVEDLPTTAEHDAPSIEISPKNHTVTSGSRAYFVCTAVGNPKPTIEWRRNSRSIFSGRYMKLDIPDGSVLRIEPVKQSRDDGASFKCIAQNGFGDPATATAVLTVISEIFQPRGFPQFVSQSSAKAVLSGDTTILPCQVLGDPRPTVTWLKNMLPLNMTVSRISIVNDSLQISDVEDEDQGSYECVAENSLGSALSHPITLYVREGKVPPRFDVRPDPLYEVIPGGNLNITCIAVGQPMPLVKWQTGSADTDQKSDALIGKNTLILENITSSVNYTCIATSRLGVIESSTELVVKVASQNSSSSTFSGNENPSDCECELHYSKEHETEKCPPAYKDGCTCPDRYDCAESNSTAEDLLTTAAHEAPTIEISPKNQTVTSGSPAFFVCTAVGNPKPTIEWRRNSRSIFSGRYIKLDIPDGSVLRIEPVKESRDDGASFICIAQNGVGDPATATVVLTVISEIFQPRGFPQFVVQSSAKAVLSGDTALLPCQALGDPRPTVTWLKNMLPLNVTLSRISIVNDSLHIADVEKEDQGNYECVAENSLGSALSRPITLYVRVGKEPPRFDVRPHPLYEVMPGSNLQITCIAVGQPMPFVKWQAGSDEMDQNSDAHIGKNTLILENITSSVNYTCIATSKLGTIESATEVVVKEGEVPPRFDVRPHPLYEVMPGSNLNITCIAVGQPMPLVKWQAGSADIDPKSEELIGKNTVILENITSSVNYTCIATSRLGTIESDTEIVVKVWNVPPSFDVHPHPLYQVIRGGNLNITCIAVGQPMPLVKWQTGSADIDQKSEELIGKNTLILENITSSVNYTCIATSRLGTIDSSTKIVLTDAPTIEISPKNQTVTSGSPAFFVCTAVGNPKPTIEWQRNSRRIFSGRYTKLDIPDGSVLRIEPVKESRDDGASFKCIAQNGVGDPATATAVLTVISEIFQPRGFPEFVAQSSAKAVLDGDTALLPCQVLGDPRPTVTWLKTMLPLNMTVSRISIVNDSLQIADVEDEDQGNYECVAENSLGSSVSHPIRLYVRVGKVPPRFDVRPQPLYEVVPGSGLNITCIAVGQPLPFVKWLAESVEIGMKSDALIGKNTLILENITSSVNYSCIATSRLGSIRSFTEIVVKDFPPSPKCPRCDLRYTKHYEAKNCSPVFIEKCSCPVRFDCPDEQITPAKVCVYKKNIYQLREAIPTGNPCQRCSCRHNFHREAEMSCLPVECPSHLIPSPREGCYEVYEKDKCCPVRVKCIDQKSQNQEMDAGMPGLFALAGGKTTLPCNVSVPQKNDTLHMIFWFKGGDHEMPVYAVDSRGTSLETAYQLPNIKLRSRAVFQVTGESPGLIIDPVQIDDAGIYWCRIDFDMSPTRILAMRLHVEPSCKYEGKIYHIGERIYPKTDPCLSCVCSENWTERNFDDCQIHDCLLERKLRFLRKGCVPIYHEKKCCPTDFYCGEAAVLNNSFLQSPGFCVFDGKSYSVGEVLDVTHPTNCVTCTCEIPPDFTCLHKTCPGPPYDDYKNCRAIYQEGQCCPTYDCLQHPACEHAKCQNGCREVSGRDGCSVCFCGDVLCSTPKCPDFCEVEYDEQVASCPRCKCNSVTVQIAPVKCTPVQCGLHCFEAVGSDGCLTCICGPLCPTPKCDARCSVQKEVPQGQCRGCVCPSNTDADLVDGIWYDQEIQCAPVICGPMCREIVGKFGCPTCICETCPPLECTSSSACEIESVPLPGECPKCVCSAS